MPDPIMRHQSAPMRLVALRLAVPDLVVVARQPGVIEAVRFTIQYHDGRHPDQVTTVTKLRATPHTVKLNAAYRRSNDKPLVLDLAIDSERFNAFNASLRGLGFDRLDDAPNIPWYGADLWLVERASGTFHHDVIISPEQATSTHAEIVRLARLHLKEAVRASNI